MDIASTADADMDVFLLPLCCCRAQLHPVLVCFFFVDVVTDSKAFTDTDTDTDTDVNPIHNPVHTAMYDNYSYSAE